MSGRKYPVPFTEASQKNRSEKRAEWWQDGVRFECQGSGQCCVSRGEFGFVYLTREERQAMAKHLGLTTTVFTRKYCAKTDGVWHLKDGKGPECIFLEGKRCAVYKVRPTQCRTWPFWPEVMNAKTWTKEVAAFCPGIGKGRRVDADEIRSTLEKQAQWEDDLAHGL